MKRSILVLMLVAAGTPARADTDADTALQQIASLPGMNLLEGSLKVKAASPGYTISGIDRSAGVEATVFKSDAGWNGSIELRRPSGFQFDELAALGSVAPRSVVIIASAQDDRIADDQLPVAIRSDLKGFLVTKKLDVVAGLNVFVSGTVGDTGLLGQLESALGANDGVVRVRGTVGEGTFKRILGAATSKSAAADPTKVSLSVSFPAMVPPALDTPVSRLHVASSTLTWTRDGTKDTISGTLAGKINIASKGATFSGKLTVTGTGDAQSLVLEASTNLMVDDLFGLDGVVLTKVALSMSAATGGAYGFDLDLGVSVAKKLYSGRFATRLQGGKVVEVSVALDGSFKLPGIKAAFGEDLTISKPTIGLMPADNAGFIGGEVTWRRKTATTVVYVRSGAEAAAFVRLGNVDLQSVVQSAKPIAQVEKLVAIVSNASMGELPLASLPSPARAMIDELGAVSVRPSSGVSVLCKLPPGDQGKSLGMSGDLVLGGQIGTDGTFGLYADLPTFTVPPGVKGVTLPKTIKPKAFLALRSDGALQLGVVVAVTVELDSSDLAAAAQFYVELGQTGGSVAVKAVLGSDWVDPFGLKGMTIGKKTALLLTASTDGSVKMLADGSATFGGKSLALGGGVSLLFSTGVPTVKGFAFRFSAPELGLTTPVEIGQVLIKAAASSMGAGTLGTKVAQDLATAAKADLVGLIGKAIPADRLATFGAALKLKEPLLFVATPGMGGGDPDFGAFDDAGVQVKGTLVMGSKELGAVDYYATIQKGLGLEASVADFSIGELDISNAKIDLGAGIPGLQNGTPPHFAISGNAELKGRSLGSVDVAISEEKVSVAGEITVFGSSVAVKGEMTSPKTFNLTGSATLDIPGEGKVAGVDVAFKQSGVFLDLDASYSGVTFQLDGEYHSSKNWSISGKINVDTSKTIDIPTGDVVVDVEGKVTWKLSDDGVSIRFVGKASGTFAGVPVTVKLDEKVSVGKITFNIAGYKLTVTVVD